jgi:demethylmenaquinone methyltransferase/2-methoxy-6-polyprenyl-1,4-benzoquinol methylase
LSGLGSRYWREVIDVLRSVIPVYDRVNRIISLGRDEQFRRRGILGRVRPADTILDAGSGFGNMSLVALAATQGDARIVMYDPIPEMLHKVQGQFRENEPILTSGVFEYLPFRSESFDAVLCGYSLRDAIQLGQAISEMHRVLKTGGRLVIVDLGKPDNSIVRFFVAFYLRYFLGTLAFAAAGRAGLKFRTLYGTFLRWPRNSQLESMLKSLFAHVEFENAMMVAAIIVAAYK